MWSFICMWWILLLLTIDQPVQISVIYQFRGHVVLESFLGQKIE